MAIHYRIGSRLDRELLKIDGPHISVADLKKNIIRLKGIGKKGGVDLEISNEQTKEVYKDESTLLAKYSTVKIALIPAAAEPKPKRSSVRTYAPAKNFKDDQALSTKHIDLASSDLPEEEKIRIMMFQSTQDYHTSNYQYIPGSQQFGQVPLHYVCHRCRQRGSHWIKNCPLRLDGKWVRKPSGIPRNFLKTVDSAVPGAMMTPDGKYAIWTPPTQPLVVPPPTTAPAKIPPPPAPDSPMSASKTLTNETKQQSRPRQPLRSRYNPYSRRDLVHL